MTQARAYTLLSSLYIKIDKNNMYAESINDIRHIIRIDKYYETESCLGILNMNNMFNIFFKYILNNMFIIFTLNLRSAYNS